MTIKRNRGPDSDGEKISCIELLLCISKMEENWLGNFSPSSLHVTQSQHEN